MYYTGAGSFVCFSESFHSVAQSGIEFMILLSYLFKCWRLQAYATKLGLLFFFFFFLNGFVAVKVTEK
jgi:hypothetical protein